MKAKRLLGLVLSAVICMTTAVCVMPTGVRAEDPVVKVGGEEVTTGYENGKGLPTNIGTGKVTYSAGNLTLNDVTVPKAGSLPSDGVRSYTNLKVNIAGENTITGNFGLITYNSSVTLEGNGTLNATGNSFGGIGAANNITINSGTIHATGVQYGLDASGTITITGGSVIAEGGTGDYKGAFNRQPEFGSKWYKWRTSAGGAFTDSQDKPYTLAEGNTYVEIVPRDAAASTSSGTLCDHEYEWVEDEAATADSDAKLVHKCKKCGNIDMRMTEANSAYVEFLRESADKITKASANATVTIEAKNWSSFQRTVIDALSKRPDVTLVVNYTEAGIRHQITIPAGTDFAEFIDENGYTGFGFLVSKGLETDYWAGKLTK